MSAARGWWVGLRCTRSGERVTSKTDGVYVQPVLAGRKLGEPWAVHGACVQGRQA